MAPFRPPLSAGDHRSTAPTAALDALLSGTAGDPLRRALWLDELDRRLRPHFPSSLAAHARLANVDGATLVVLVDSPIWHARMRLAASELLDAARSIGLDVTRIAIKTARQSVAPLPRTGPAALPMSATARDALRDALASLQPPEAGTSSDTS